MNSLLKFGKHFAIPATFVFTVQFGIQAQNPVTSTQIDEKYAYTTIVYKNAAASDKDVLAAVESDFGIGDVVRVSLAPPPTTPTAIAASEPVYADKNKGEDAWMPQSGKPASNLTASSNRDASPQLAIKTVASAPMAVPIAHASAVPKPVISAKPAAINTPVLASVEAEKTSVAPVSTASNTTSGSKASVSGKATKAHKSIKKSGKKSGQKVKLRNRRHGKQHYSCPTF